MVYSLLFSRMKSSFFFLFWAQTCDVSPVPSVKRANEIDSRIRNQLRENLLIFVGDGLQIKMRDRRNQNQRNPNPDCQKRNDADIEHKYLEGNAPDASGARRTF